MKKALILSLFAVGLFIMVPSIEANTAAPSASALSAPQIRIRIGGNRHRGRTRTVTRIVREGRWRYRETVRITYFPNGGSRTQVISRQRL